MEIKLTDEQKKTLMLFAYYCRGFGGDEVSRRFYYQYGSEDWADNNWNNESGGSRDIESYDKIDELIDYLFEEYDLMDLADDDNYLTLEFEIDCIERVLSINAWERVNHAENSERLITSEEDEDLKKYCESKSSEGFNMGIVRFEGSGDSGAVEDSIELHGDSPKSETIPDDMETLCYTMLSDFPGWEINEGSQGQFIFEFNEGNLTLEFEQNFYDDESIDFKGIAKF